MTNNECDEEIYELFQFYKMKVDEKNKENGNIIIKKYNLLSAISILLEAKSTICNEPWTIEQNGKYLIQCDLELATCSKVLNENNESIPKILETENNNSLSTSTDVKINGENLDKLLEEERFLTAKKMKCLQDSDIEIRRDPDNVELFRDRNIKEINPHCIDNFQYLSIEDLFSYYNILYLINFQLNSQKHEIAESSVLKVNAEVLSTGEVNLFEEIITIMKENTKTKTKTNIENSNFFIGYPCLNPDIVYNIILNNHYKKMDLLVDKVIRAPTDQIIRDECHKLCPIPKVKHKPKLFTRHERIMFLNGISNKQYNIDQNNCNKVMINIALAITAHAGFDISNKQCLNVLAEVTITYIKKLAIIMKKDLDTLSRTCYNTDHTYSTLHKFDVKDDLKDDVKEMLKICENDIIARRNKLIIDCEQLQHFINQYLLNPIPVIDKIQNQYITFMDVELINEPLLIQENKENVSSIENKIEKEFMHWNWNWNKSFNTEVKQTESKIDDNIRKPRIVNLIEEYVYIHPHIKKKILKIIINLLLESIDYENDDYSIEYQKLQHVFEDTIHKYNKKASKVKENIPTNIETKQTEPVIDNTNDLFKPSTSTDPNYIEYDEVNITSPDVNVIKNKNVFLKKKKTKESKIDNKNTNFNISTFIDTKLIEYVLTNKAYQNKICVKFILDFLHGDEINKPFVEFIIEKYEYELLKNNRTKMESKTEENENAEMDFSKSDALITFTTSNPTSFENKISNATCNDGIKSIHATLNIFLTFFFEDEEVTKKLVLELKDIEKKSNLEKKVSETEPIIDNTYKRVELSALLDPNGIECMKASATFTNDRKMQQSKYTNNTKNTNTTNIKKTFRKFDDNIMNSDLLKPLLFEEDNNYVSKLISVPYSKRNFIHTIINDKDTLIPNSKINENEDNDINCSSFSTYLQDELKKGYTTLSESIINGTIKQPKRTKYKLKYLNIDYNEERQDTEMTNSEDTVNCDVTKQSTLLKLKSNSIDVETMKELLKVNDYEESFEVMLKKERKAVKQMDDDFKRWKDSQDKNKTMDNPLPPSNVQILNGNTFVQAKIKQHTLIKMIKIYIKQRK